MSVFPYVYLIDEKQWIPRHAAFLTPPHPDMHSLDSASWNTSCLECHTRTVCRNLTPMTTRAAEFGISCEACHGPGAEHVAANRDPMRRYEGHRDAATGSGDPTIVNPANLSRDLSAHVCARCHSLYGGYYGTPEELAQHGYKYWPGQDLHQTMLRTRFSDWKTNLVLKVAFENNPAMLKDYFWDDGMIRVAGRE